MNEPYHKPESADQLSSKSVERRDQSFGELPDPKKSVAFLRVETLRALVGFLSIVFLHCASFSISIDRSVWPLIDGVYLASVTLVFGLVFVLAAFLSRFVPNFLVMIFLVIQILPHAMREISQRPKQYFLLERSDSRSQIHRRVKVLGWKISKRRKLFDVLVGSLVFLLCFFHFYVGYWIVPIVIFQVLFFSYLTPIVLRSGDPTKIVDILFGRRGHRREAIQKFFTDERMASRILFFSYIQIAVFASVLGVARFESLRATMPVQIISSEYSGHAAIIARSAAGIVFFEKGLGPFFIAYDANLTIFAN